MLPNWSTSLTKGASTYRTSVRKSDLDAQTKQRLRSWGGKRTRGPRSAVLLEHRQVEKILGPGNGSLVLDQLGAADDADRLIAKRGD